ncbi:MAG: hypothetical protein FJY85_22930, partial [Deltaproteobacteria bacterium]|nr:hypothetical protein [Deltaproteobacteria bacterium]
MDEELSKILKYLRWRGLLANRDAYLSLADKQRFSPVRLLRYVVEEEYKRKHQNARMARLNRARIPHLLEIETFPFDKQPKLDRKKILSLYDA